MCIALSRGVAIYPHGFLCDGLGRRGSGRVGTIPPPNGKSSSGSRGTYIVSQRERRTEPRRALIPHPVWGGWTFSDQHGMYYGVTTKETFPMSIPDTIAIDFISLKDPVNVDRVAQINRLLRQIVYSGEPADIKEFGEEARHYVWELAPGNPVVMRGRRPGRRPDGSVSVEQEPPDAE